MGLWRSGGRVRVGKGQETSLRIDIQQGRAACGGECDGPRHAPANAAGPCDSYSRADDFLDCSRKLRL